MGEPLDVKNTRIQKSQFKCVDMSGSVFDDVNLSGSTFRNVNLGKCTVEDACMAQTTISDFNWEGTRIEGILVIDLLGAYEKVHGRQEEEGDSE